MHKTVLKYKEKVSIIRLLAHFHLLLINFPCMSQVKVKVHRTSPTGSTSEIYKKDYIFIQYLCKHVKIQIKKMAESRPIHVSVIEGEFASLKELGFTIPVCMQLQQGGFTISKGMWTAKQSSSGFSISFFWPEPQQGEKWARLFLAAFVINSTSMAISLAVSVSCSIVWGGIFSIFWYSGWSPWQKDTPIFFTYYPLRILKRKSPNLISSGVVPLCLTISSSMASLSNKWYRKYPCESGWSEAYRGWCI